ncbi:MAG: cytochrome C oxidase subunit IV [Methylococcus sp.]|jgi:cytochrome c oxidase subunit IV|nr:cytochrome C oxidase subunit IV family protein [Methylococcales bacterium]RUM52208.1 MAG: cytochrome C oxidase subunit IV [Methylococcus sp.]
MEHAEGQQQHPVGLYFKIWILLFVLSTFSYLVDYLDFQGYLRWTLIIIFMLLKAGFIVAIFMHMMWERMALICAILLPPLALGVLISLMAIEGDTTFLIRSIVFGQEQQQSQCLEQNQECEHSGG